MTEDIKSKKNSSILVDFLKWIGLSIVGGAIGALAYFALKL